MSTVMAEHTLPSELSTDQLLDAYRVMRTIREFEERIHAEYASGAIPGAVHLYAGQEAVAAGFCAHLRPDDYIASTHRGHGHAIAKGCDLAAMMLEIYGKADGVCGGKGGSMHIADIEAGMLGANGIAAGGVPMLCGAALAARLRGTGQVGVAFVGDGGANQGAFLESLNLAAVWQLPCVFVVENNGYAQTTAPSFHLKGDVAARAAGFGMPGTSIDGYDFFAVHAAADVAIRRAREGGGPSLVECTAVRFFGHMEGYDRQAYRPAGEADELRANHDCLRLFTARVTAGRASGTAGPPAGVITTTELADIDAAARSAVAGAVAQAEAAPEPTAADLTTDVYVSY